MQNYNVLDERKNISEKEYLLDLIGGILDSKSENEFLKFTLTSETFLKMCEFPVRKIVKYCVPSNGEQIIEIQLIGSIEEQIILSTEDECETFTVISINTDKIKYDLRKINFVSCENVKNYIIDMK